VREREGGRQCVRERVEESVCVRERVDERERARARQPRRLRPRSAYLFCTPRRENVGFDAILYRALEPCHFPVGLVLNLRSHLAAMELDAARAELENLR